MKTLAALLALLLLPVAARADLTITQQIQQDTPQAKGLDMTMTMKIKGQKARVDLNPQMSTIVDIKTGDTLTIMHQQKAVMTIPGAIVKSMQQQAMASQKADPSQTAAPTPTGRTETINGYKCEEYQMTSNGMKMQLWMTKDIPAADRIMADLSSLSSDLDPFKGAMKNQQLTGYPMRTVIEIPGTGKTTVTTLSLNEDPLPESEFTAPAGYKTMQMPSIPGQ